MRKLRYLLTLALCLGLIAGCHKSGKPSPDYQKARTLWLDLLRDKMGKAYSDPGAQEVIGLLERVDPSSMDARVAADLKAEIQKGRAEALASDEAVRQQVAQAQNAVNNPTFTGTGTGYRFAVAAEGDGGTGETGDAGPRGPEQPKIGMSADEFERKFSRCFESRADAAFNGQLGGRIWAMRDLVVCRELYPSLIDSAIVIFEGKVVSILPMAEAAPQKYKLVDGKLVPMSEADKIKFAAQNTATPAAPTAPPEPPPPPGRPPIQTTGPGASVAQPIAPAADPSLNPKSSLSGSPKP
jgi:hypothetical protein